ncbi:hypothetical protein PHYBLDRAFT_182803 [Phycomyces blakesleeanus NRRL 1555(-)]|uniref:SMP-LTD domain-containing protein n=1 Tax=Phycomyces blakesleeanus (strain ATCC 8743b / DSM 1359 / FGSC 10004 / NBRC 33097 / NRRL 1555) TaxID=763407 RepID=A0A162TM71_PHYB8|nr:hypothetical protein PHYBLDRAFT_182803 [Phycomyces blakesleeanus NRRL 1555(-)]OAD69622.1 hypothetical protein PHYBLDRAFT_182803 [Phycomyces blakesleeanus NRRL 1555(-)]|eukprot:XP_018287662.1 hypothetical protein PHYBLDRAFT_182803 [Phycomyces blakesleeanus NRRL 1555(-)]
MISVLTFACIYLLGGLTSVPIILYGAYYYSSSRKQGKLAYMTLDEHYHEKRGWIMLSNEYQDNPETIPSTGLMAGIQSYINSNSSSSSHNSNKKAREPLYAVIKHNTMFVFNSEQEEECRLIIPVHDYNISIYPPRTTDAGIFGRTSSILLEPKKPSNTKKGSEEYNLQHSLYLKCTRATDKEDWYLGLKAASTLMDDVDSVNQTSAEMVNSTMFSLSAADRWMSSVMRPEEDGHTDWLNGILGRLFLGVYRTDKARAYFEAKLVEKIKKMRRPGFVEQIKVRRVDPGQSVPRLVKPRLVSITPQGMLVADVDIEYDGGLSVEIETDVSWSYSSRRKPIRLQLVLAVKLKTFSGKCMFKIKPPPSNRCWIGFYETPDMTWEFTSIVSEKQIKLQMVMNAMEAKIREIITDSMVLPNMEDFKYMETDGQGGIFGTRIARDPEVDNQDRLEAYALYQLEKEKEKNKNEKAKNDKSKNDKIKVKGKQKESKSTTTVGEQDPSSVQERPCVLTTTATTTTVKIGPDSLTTDSGLEPPLRRVESDTLPAPNMLTFEKTTHSAPNLLLENEPLITDNESSVSDSVEETETMSDRQDSESVYSTSSKQAKSIISAKNSLLSKISRRISDARDNPPSDLPKSSFSTKKTMSQLATSFLHKAKPDPETTAIFTERIAGFRRRSGSLGTHSPSLTLSREDNQSTSIKIISTPPPKPSRTPQLSRSLSTTQSKPPLPPRHAVPSSTDLSSVQQPEEQPQEQPEEKPSQPPLPPRLSVPPPIPARSIAHDS